MVRPPNQKILPKEIHAPAMKRPPPKYSPVTNSSMLEQMNPLQHDKSEPLEGVETLLTADH